MLERSSIEPFIEEPRLAARLGRAKKRLQSAAQRFRQCATPRFCFLRIPIHTIKGDTVSLQDGPAFRSRKLARALDPCTEMVCFVATLGPGVDVEIEKLMQANRLTDAYVMDALGSTGVESMVEQFYGRVMADCRRAGKGVSIRFSPGHCDWPVTEQKKLFTLFDPNVTGVELHESCLMNPRKSVSGMIGTFLRSDDNAPETLYHPCRDCEKSFCTERRN
jgi:hypothetical protein